MPRHPPDNCEKKEHSFSIRHFTDERRRMDRIDVCGVTMNGGTTDDMYYILSHEYLIHM